VIGNIVWIIFFGWELALLHLIAGLLLMITFIGVPFGIACWKMIPLSLVPPSGARSCRSPTRAATRTASPPDRACERPSPVSISRDRHVH
jgi:uncharacterized membrane protein YccF (DUF307 family)